MFRRHHEVSLILAVGVVHHDDHLPLLQVGHHGFDCIERLLHQRQRIYSTTALATATKNPARQNGERGAFRPKTGARPYFWTRRVAPLTDISIFLASFASQHLSAQPALATLALSAQQASVFLASPAWMLAAANATSARDKTSFFIIVI